MTFVIAGISHKGGTGRSVTLANLGYHLYISGASVLVVDLDLASPTMGSILGLREEGAGVLGRKSREYEALNISDVIEDGGQIGSECFIDLRRKSPEIERVKKNDRLFQFLPGSIGDGDWSESQGKLNKVMGNLISNLRGGSWDYILLDIRSGLSGVLEAIGGDGQYQIDLNIVHFRWTAQHLVGLHQMLSDVRLAKRHEDSIKLVRTAKPLNLNDEYEATKSFIRRQDEELISEFRKIKFNNVRLHDESEHLIGDVPFDSRLRWKEHILTENKSDGADPSNLTYEQFSKLAKNVQELRNK